MYLLTKRTPNGRVDVVATAHSPNKLKTLVDRITNPTTNDWTIINDKLHTSQTWSIAPNPTNTVGAVSKIRRESPHMGALRKK